MSLNVFWDATKKGFNITLLENNLRAVCSTSSNSSAGVFANTGRNEGKWYWEIHFKKTTNGDESIGIANDSTPFNHNSSNGSPPNFAGINTYHSIITNLISSQSNISISGIDLNSGMELTYGFALDLDSNLLEVYINGESKGIVNNIRNNNESYIYPYYLGHRFNDTTVGGAYANFGATPFIYPVPEGFLPYNFSFTNKSLILHDGGYKKWNETRIRNDVNIITTNTFTPISSGDYDSGRNKETAFNGSIDVYTKSWASLEADNQYLGVTFTEPKVVNRIKISSPSNTLSVDTSGGIMPKSFFIQGSNNLTNWNSITTISNQTNWSNSETREYSFENRDSYTSYRVLITELNRTHKVVYISELEMYEDAHAVLGWSTVSSTLPSSQQFLSDGMGSLSPLLDRKVTELELLPMSVKSEILPVSEEGKVFSKTIDLKKYLDIRSMKVEVR